VAKRSSQNGTGEENETVFSDGGSIAHNMDRKMLSLLVCPQTKGTLEFEADAQELISRKANLAYPVRDNVPILLISEARVLDD